MADIHTVSSAILGHAVADALGVPAEFMMRETLEKQPITDMTGFGSHKVPKGSWSDDTFMTLCTLNSIAQKGYIDPEDIMREFTMWAQDGYMTPGGEVFDIGRTCLRSIMNYCRGRRATECGEFREYSNGNGSLMRMIPVSLYNHFKGSSDKDAIQNIHTVSALTHSHPRSLIACGIYDFIIRALIDRPCKQAVDAALSKAKAFYADEPEIVHYHRLFDPAFNHLPVSQIKSTGYVVHTLEAAVWCLKNTDSYAECVLKAVNLGNDTDTVSAVAGGMAGILYGYRSIPDEWIAALIKHQEISALCESFYKRIQFRKCSYGDQ